MYCALCDNCQVLMIRDARNLLIVIGRFQSLKFRELFLIKVSYLFLKNCCLDFLFYFNLEGIRNSQILEDLCMCIISFI